MVEPSFRRISGWCRRYCTPGLSTMKPDRIFGASSGAEEDSSSTQHRLEVPETLQIPVLTKQQLLTNDWQRLAYKYSSSSLSRETELNEGCASALIQGVSRGLSYWHYIVPLLGAIPFCLLFLPTVLLILCVIILQINHLNVNPCFRTFPRK